MVRRRSVFRVEFVPEGKEYFLALEGMRVLGVTSGSGVGWIVSTGGEPYLIAFGRGYALPSDSRLSVPRPIRRHLDANLQEVLTSPDGTRTSTLRSWAIPTSAETPFDVPLDPGWPSVLPVGAAYLRFDFDFGPKVSCFWHHSEESIGINVIGPEEEGADAALAWASSVSDTVLVRITGGEPLSAGRTRPPGTQLLSGANVDLSPWQ